MTSSLKPLTEQVILITGASSGIGLATARRAAAAGASVMLVARSGDVLARIVREMEAAGGSAAFAVADVGDGEALAAAAAAAVARFGRIDTWVNNAGVAIYSALLDTPDDEHERLFRTNYWGLVNGCRIAVEHLRRNGGALVTVGSIAAEMPSPVLGAYTASKHAAKGYVDSLRIELQAAGLPIAVSLVKPSGVATPIAQHAANHQAHGAKVPPPAYRPELVADAILDCAVTGRREVTVGGAGRAMTLFAAHFPGAFDRLAPLVVPLLSSAKVPKTEASLFSGGGTGEERSRYEPGKPFSLYTALRLRPWLSGTLLAAGVAGGALALARRRNE